MASILDYYYSLIGANKAPDTPAAIDGGVSISGTNQVQAPQIQADLSTPSIASSGAGPSASTAGNAADAASAATGAGGTSKAASQFGKSGMSNAQAGMMIGNAIGDAFTKANTTPTVSIPRADPIQTTNFKFPTITYQGGR